MIILPPDLTIHKQSLVAAGGISARNCKAFVYIRRLASALCISTTLNPKFLFFAIFLHSAFFRFVFCRLVRILGLEWFEIRVFLKKNLRFRDTREREWVKFQCSCWSFLHRKISYWRHTSFLKCKYVFLNTLLDISAVFYPNRDLFFCNTATR